ncbi:MAG TPA: HAD-IA family hydrolase [Bacteroidia bacterium]
MSTCSHLMPKAVEILDQLALQSEMVIITNGISSVQRARFANSPISKYFSHLFVSGDVENDPEFHKPHRKIFEYAHRNSFPDIGIEKILMVGDNLRTDIAGGQNYQIDTCWFNRERKINDTAIFPTYEISELDSLVGIVKG